MNNNTYSRIILIPLRHAHHAEASGYSRIQELISGKVVKSVVDWTLFWRVLAWVFRKIYKNSGSVWYHRTSFIREFKSAIIWFQERHQVFHFFYGENSYRYFGNLKYFGKRNYIICTYHTPPHRFKEVVKNPEHLKNIDGLIVLSTSTIGYFSSIVGKDRVYYVPRSVDIEYFKPNENYSNGEDFNCLFVGNHLRDFETLAKTARALWELDKTIKIVVVTPSSYHDYFHGLSNIILLEKIEDCELLRLYQESQVLVLPLTDATANNVIVEAMACGLPIITSDIVGVRDYANDECAIFVPRFDVKALTNSVVNIKNNKAGLKHMSVKARERALDFSIEKIAEKTQLVYEKVAAKQGVCI